jgi:hypothetical protein
MVEMMAAGKIQNWNIVRVYASDILANTSEAKLSD